MTEIVQASWVNKDLYFEISMPGAPAVTSILCGWVYRIETSDGPRWGAYSLPLSSMCLFLSEAEAQTGLEKWLEDLLDVVVVRKDDNG